MVKINICLLSDSKHLQRLHCGSTTFSAISWPLQGSGSIIHVSSINKTKVLEGEGLHADFFIVEHSRNSGYGDLSCPTLSDQVMLHTLCKQWLDGFALGHSRSLFAELDVFKGMQCTFFIACVLHGVPLPLLALFLCVTGYLCSPIHAQPVLCGWEFSYI